MISVKDFCNLVRCGDSDGVRGMLVEVPSLVLLKDEGATALHYAAIHNNKEIVELLLEYGADLNAEDDEYHGPPAAWANEKGHTEMVRYLAGRGANIGFPEAAAFGLIEKVREGLKHRKGEINTLENFGTPLHKATLWGHHEIVELLLKHGADPTIPNADGKTAYQIALHQVESNAEDTPIVIDSRREEIVTGCKKILEILRGRGIRE